MGTLTPETKIALLERTMQDHGRRIEKNESAIETFKEFTSSVRALKWLVGFAMTLWPAAIYFLQIK